MHTHIRQRPPVHPLCALLRELRLEAGFTLLAFEEKYKIPAVVVGAYERGDREPPLRKLDAVLSAYGYQLWAVPTGPTAVRLPTDIVGDLRAIADQIETRYHRSKEPVL